MSNFSKMREQDLMPVYNIVLLLLTRWSFLIGYIFYLQFQMWQPIDGDGLYL